ncbi:hypothetical protein [Bifidobacterium sp. ESL0704]|uniref:hypothetical protein n=1 Tax=Bifidobacterium sp. ESL0704 TaxID=2983219 RepID=UPI0023FA1960|nr:hypothetical protein [Bifidobacterium sp. ESL0704]WEV53139.1 hypothetical protein OZX64_01160 [Bifidobacterium sp. ESL0704]
MTLIRCLLPHLSRKISRFPHVGATKIGLIARYENHSHYFGHLGGTKTIKNRRLLVQSSIFGYLGGTNIANSGDFRGLLMPAMKKSYGNGNKNHCQPLGV